MIPLRLDFSKTQRSKNTDSCIRTIHAGVVKLLQTFKNKIPSKPGTCTGGVVYERARTTAGAPVQRNITFYDLRALVTYGCLRLARYSGYVVRDKNGHDRETTRADRIRRTRDGVIYRQTRASVVVIRSINIFSLVQRRRRRRRRASVCRTRRRRNYYYLQLRAHRTSPSLVRPVVITFIYARRRRWRRSESTRECLVVNIIIPYVCTDTPNTIYANTHTRVKSKRITKPPPPPSVRS